MNIRKIQAVWIGILIASAAALFAAFGTSEKRTVTDIDGQTYEVWGREDQIYKAWTVDTLTTTEKDTLALGYTLSSPYQFSYQIYCKKLSGTPNLKIVLDQRNSMTNTDWLGVDSISVAGADSIRTYFAIRGTNTYGLQHRLRLVGTTGVNRYRITGLLKKTAQW